MVAARKVKCFVITVPADEAASNNDHLESNVRPSDLLPWADPYIRGLVSKLQDEVRQERRAERLSRRVSEPLLEPVGAGVGDEGPYGWGI